MTGERRALIVSAVAACCIGLVAVIVALKTGSRAILVDAAFNLAFFATSLVTLHVARLLQRPDDRRFPFGYVQFEPLINMVKGLLILGINLLAAFDSAVSLFTGGTEVSADLALGYAVFALLACGGVLFALRRMQASAASPLVDADIENWLVNLAISVGMFVAFCLALVLQVLGQDTAARLVDPLLLALVVAITIGVPIRMAGRGLMALLKRAPDDPVVTSVERQVERALADLPRRALHVRVLQPGRTTYAMVHVLLDETDNGLDLDRMDTLRRLVVAAVAERHAPLIVDIVFTKIEAFAAPTTGFASAAGTATT